MSWDQVHRRTAALRSVLARADRRRDGALDWDSMPDARAAFGTEEALLQALQQRWQAHLLARLDGVFEDETTDRHRAVRRVIHQLRADMPGLAAVLERHGRRPELAPAQRRLASLVDQACPCGRAHPFPGRLSPGTSAPAQEPVPVAARVPEAAAEERPRRRHRASRWRLPRLARPCVCTAVLAALLPDRGVPR